MRLFLSILLFIIALGTLITIHEFGHFIAAKSFDVYCEDFSIGFGHKIFRIGRKGETKKSALVFIKSKKNETAFSIGLVPLGGYVSLLGEGSEDKVKKDPNLKGRSLNDKSFWKRLIIAGGGIFMNFVLAFVVFFISVSCFVQHDNFGYNVFGIYDQNEFSTSLTLDRDGTKKVNISTDNYKIIDDDIKEFYLLDVSEITYNNIVYSNIINDVSYPVKISGHDSFYSVVFNSEKASLNEVDYSNCLSIVAAEKVTIKDKNGNFNEIYLPKVINGNEYSYYNFEKGDVIEPISINILKISSNDDNYDLDEVINCYLNLKINDNLQFEKLGFGIFIYEHKYNFTQSLKKAGKLWVDGTTLVGRTLISLFYDKLSWKQIGGPIAIFSQTTSILNNYPFYYYLQTWGMISVNLALFNLLPFPGLDGFTIIITLIEAIVNAFKNPKKKNKKEQKEKENLDIEEVYIGEEVIEENKEWKISPKIKNAISFVGLFLIFALMIFIFIKDIVRLL